jgi:hypothetical protein
MSSDGLCDCCGVPDCGCPETGAPAAARLDLSRREFLRSAAVAAAAAALPAWFPRSAIAGGHDPEPAPGKKTRHLVFVALAGGVRTKETFLAPENVPNLMKLAEQGVLATRVRTRNVGHYGALLSLFTGCVEVMGIRENTRGKNPTLFEYLRRAKHWGAEKVWLSTAGGPQQANLSYSLDARYGKKYEASVIDSEGVFNQEFKTILDRFGRPRPASEKEEAAVQSLHETMGETSSEAARIEKFIMDEINKQTAKVTGPGARDAKAIRLATTILQVFRPPVIGIALQNADVAHGSYNGYVEVIRRNDEELGRLVQAIQRDPELKDSTSIIVCPEFGRDRDLNQRNGLDHGDNSDELLKIAMVAAGPDWKKGKKLEREVDWVDLCPTVCNLFGVKPESAEGRGIAELLA